MKKIVLLFSLLGVICYVVFFQKREKRMYTIAILQGASHPSLDAANSFFKDTLMNLLGKDKIAFLSYNAEGSPTQAHAIAQRIQANKTIDLFYAIDCATAQALAHVEKKRPIVFIGVEDPEERGFLKKDTNMCGVTDLVPSQAYIELIEKTVGVKKKVGLLYKNETSRKIIAKEIKETLEKNNYIVEEFTPSNEIELLSQLDSIPSGIEVLLSPADSMIAANIGIIVDYQRKKKKPFLVCMKNSAFFGALASRGTDYEMNGGQAARMAYDILFNGKKPCDIPLESGGYKELFLNKKTMQVLDIKIPREEIFTLV